MLLHFSNHLLEEVIQTEVGIVRRSAVTINVASVGIILISRTAAILTKTSLEIAKV